MAASSSSRERTRTVDTTNDHARGGRERPRPMTHMHIPDGILPVWLWLSGLFIMVLALSISLASLRSMDAKRKIPLLGALSAVMLVAMSLETPPDRVSHQPLGGCGHPSRSGARFCRRLHYEPYPGADGTRGDHGRRTEHAAARSGNSAGAYFVLPYGKTSSRVLEGRQRYGADAVHDDAAPDRHGVGVAY